MTTALRLQIGGIFYSEREHSKASFLQLFKKKQYCCFVVEMGMGKKPDFKVNSLALTLVYVFVPFDFNVFNKILT